MHQLLHTINLNSFTTCLQLCIIQAEFFYQVLLKWLQVKIQVCGQMASYTKYIFLWVKRKTRQADVPSWEINTFRLHIKVKNGCLSGCGLVADTEYHHDTNPYLNVGGHSALIVCMSWFSFIAGSKPGGHSTPIMCSKTLVGIEPWSCVQWPWWK